MACVLSACAQKGNTDTMKVIAHRGGASLGPENTLSCIEKGIQAGADGIEVDIHLSADGAVIVCHDETIDRTTDGVGRIEELSLEQLRSVHIKGASDEEKLPTLEEVLLLIKDRCPLLLEIKKTRDGQYAGIEEKVIALLDSTGTRNQVVVQSFNDSILKEFHRLAPDIPLEKLLVCRLPFGLAVDIGLRRFSLEDYPWVQSFNTNNVFTSRRFVRDVHALGKTVRVWTVERPSQVVSGVDCVITNHPQNFRKK